MTPAPRWPAEAIWEAVAPRLPGFTVEILPEVDSSNTELMRRARAGQGDPVLLVAERQTAGRGRMGRAWQADRGDSLTFSIGLPLAPADWSGLSLAVGVSVAESLDTRVGLKWPNDLWVDGRKLGGILVETAGTASAGAVRYAVIGVGINLAPRAADGLSTPPAALRELWPGAQAGDVLQQLAPALVAAVLDFQQSGFPAVQARYEARDLLRGRAVTLSDGSSGTALGVSPQGGLLVHTASGVTTVTSAEVSVRPA